MSKKKKTIAILISGTGSNMLAIADSVSSGILENHYAIALVVSNNPNAPGLKAAKLRGITVNVINGEEYSKKYFDQLLLDALEPYDPDYIVLAGYNKLLSTAFVDRYKQRIINIHPADTRLYKGLHGYKWAFKQKRTSTAITVHWVDEGCDTGKIIVQQDVCLKGLNSLEDIQKAGLAVEHKLYSSVLRNLATK